MIELYGFGPSRWVKCYWMLKELGLEFREHNLSFVKGEHRTPGKLAKDDDHDEEDGQRPDCIAEIAGKRTERGRSLRRSQGKHSQRQKRADDKGLCDGISVHLIPLRSTSSNKAPALRKRAVLYLSTAIIPTTTAKSVAPSIMAAVMIIAVEI